VEMMVLCTTQPGQDSMNLDLKTRIKLDSELAFDFKFSFINETYNTCKLSISYHYFQFFVQHVVRTLGNKISSCDIKLIVKNSFSEFWLTNTCSPASVVRFTMPT